MSLESQLTAIQKQLAALKTQARKASGKAQKRAKRLERKTRVKLERTVRTLEPKVRAAVAEARLIARGVRAGQGSFLVSPRIFADPPAGSYLARSGNSRNIVSDFPQSSRTHT